MIVLLKMRASDKIFDKICLKATTSFSNMWPVIKGQGDSIFWWGWYLTEAESWNFLACREIPQIPSLSGTSWSSHKENAEEGAEYCNDFEKSEWEYFLSNQ